MHIAPLSDACGDAVERSQRRKRSIRLEKGGRDFFRYNSSVGLFDLDSELLLRLLLAVVYGGALGFEREAAGRAAGLRTVILVCLGSTLITMISVTLPSGVQGELAQAIVRMDPGRISAGIVTGVGFLGGAVVIKLGDLVRGVTTAASIWFAAALGIALGQGHFALATWATVIALTVLTIFPLFSRSIAVPVYRRVWVGLGADVGEARKEIAEALASMSVRVMDLHASRDDTGTELVYHVRCAQNLQGADVVERLASMADVRSARWG